MSTTSNGSEATLAPRIEVDEHEEHTIEEYPPNIVEQLKRASFDRTPTGTFVKHHRTLNGSGKPKVVEVEVEESQLTISVNKIVGVVNLTPTSKLQINPKIGWKDILEIFLTVQEQDRSLDYHGIPIRDFLADDLRIEDIFVVVAVNYLNSLEPLFRNGFLRDYDTRRVDAIDARGQIDIDQSLKNHTFSGGVAKQHFVQKVIDYSTPANVLVYEAGQELRHLFQQYADTYDHHGYYQIFSRLEETLQRLESRGISSEGDRLSELSEITLADLPRQRHYYGQALNISKTILSSSIGEPLDQGRDDLTMDYILSMESLFERYANLVLKEQLQQLQNDELYSGGATATVGKESNQLFEESTDYSQQPDHVIREGKEPVAALDTKYYAEDHNPLTDTYARSRLLAYAYQLEVDEVAFLCPRGEAATHSFAGREGELEIVSPAEFSVETFTGSIREYLCKVLDISTDEALQKHLSRYATVVPGVSVNFVDDVAGTRELAPGQLENGLYPTFKNLVNQHSTEMSHFRNLDNWKSFYDDFKNYLETESEGYDYVVPLFVPVGVDLQPDLRSEDDEGPADAEEEDVGDDEDATEFERILFYCFITGPSGEVTDWDVPETLKLEWDN